MRSSGKYALKIRLEIEEMDARGQYAGRGLTIAESIDLVDVASFMEIAAILGRFHELAQQIEEERASVLRPGPRLGTEPGA